MADIPATLVVKLREMTNAGMMDCKRTLLETNGDLNAAVDLLRKRGMATAAKKATRDANQGAIAASILPGAKVGVLIEVNCETDFVAKNEMFLAFAEKVARTIAEDPTQDVEAMRTDAVSRIRENIKIARSNRLEVQGNGMVAGYIHTGAKVGVLVEVGAGQEATTATDDFKQLVKDITLQIAAANPVAVCKEDVDPAFLEKEREIVANSDLVKNKPPQAVAKIIEGKLEKYFKDNCLLNQGFVKRNGEITVQEHVAAVARQLGDEITVRRFLRYQVGEAFAAA
ncbi:MAG: translation elongation factor Ts [Limisphaerales bacterium]